MLKALMNKKVGIETVNIRGFVGVVGSGKDFNCQKLVDNENYVQINFADGLRDMAWKILNWKPKNQEEYDLFKKGQIIIPFFGRVDGRKFLQELGHAMRNVDKDFWVKLWKRNVEDAISQGYNNICCSDVRYQNEIDMIKSYNWKADIKITFCDYHSERYDCTNAHESEKMAQELLRQGYQDGDLI